MDSSEASLTPTSPFFRPSFSNFAVVEQSVATPQGRNRRRRNVVAATAGIVEHKSSLLGCAANMMTTIVGSGIVGLPYAMQQTGFVAGIGLILLTAALTEKSLRLLVETAKHLHKQTYETAAEVAFGVAGFRFILINMFIMAWGAMISYLMITKSCLAQMSGIDDTLQQQLLLLFVSAAVQLPLACLRDMADLEKTSGLAVAVDCTIVGLVAVCSPWIEMKGMEENNILELMQTDVIHPGSLFVGLGVLSFAFECQEAAFLVAGSLEKPTVNRWAKVTSMALTACFLLAMACAILGYLGYGPDTKGNILDNLDPSSTASYVAHGMLGATMFATYPLASFVARHVCVALLFEGREAHEGGSDSSILNRPDRRILLTLLLYVTALVPATLSSNMGSVLAIAGVIGGSSLAYIGPGMLFLAVHGGRFIMLTDDFFLSPSQEEEGGEGLVSESTALLNTTQAKHSRKADGLPKTLLWYVGGFPLWSRIAATGKQAVLEYAEKIAADNTLEPLRIGDVDHTPIEKMAEGATTKQAKAKQTSIKGAPNVSIAHLIRPRSNSDPDAKNAPIDVKSFEASLTIQSAPSLEADPQAVPPEALDFLIAIFYICFGLVALLAGLFSLGA